LATIASDPTLASQAFGSQRSNANATAFSNT
jgi:hypothetical protein